MREVLLEKIRELMIPKKIPATISALADAAGVSRSTIYKYYPDFVCMVKSVASSAASIEPPAHVIKLEVMRKKIIKQAEIIAYLTNICSNQLIELSETAEFYIQQDNSKNLKINYLESKLAKIESRSLKSVK
jgi:ACT domain-containing protein